MKDESIGKITALTSKAPQNAGLRLVHSRAADGERQACGPNERHSAGRSGQLKVVFKDGIDECEDFKLIWICAAYPELDGLLLSLWRRGYDTLADIEGATVKDLMGNEELPAVHVFRRLISVLDEHALNAELVVA